MFKFFRLYNKQILVVCGAVLMVIFLIGPAIQVLQPSNDYAIGQVNGEEIYNSQLQRAEADMQMLRVMANSPILPESLIRVLAASKDPMLLQIAMMAGQGNARYVTFMVQQMLVMQMRNPSGQTDRLVELIRHWQKHADSIDVDSLAGQRIIKLAEALQSKDQQQIITHFSAWAQSLADAQAYRQLMLELLPTGSQEPIRWVLMQQEAKMLNLDGSPMFGRHLIDAAMINPQTIFKLKEKYHMDDQSVLRVMAQLQRVWLLKGQLTGTAGLQQVRQVVYGGWEQSKLMPMQQVSVQQVRHEAWNQFTSARANYVTIPVTALSSVIKDYQPSEQEIKDQFERYKNVAPGSDIKTGGFGFGYLMQPRVKLSYLKVGLNEVSKTIDVTELDAYTYFREHMARFHAMAQDRVSGATTSRPAASQPATMPVPTTENQATTLYRQVRRDVIEALKNERAKQKQARIVGFIQERLAELRRQAPELAAGPNEKGYYNVPADQKLLPDLNQVAQMVQARFKVLPEVMIDDRWTTLARLRSYVDFADAKLPFYNQQGRQEWAPVSAYIGSARQLAKQRTVLSQFHLQQGIVSQPVTNQKTGSVFLFRLNEVVPASPPADLSVVKTDIERDLKQLHAYKQLKAGADDYLKAAGQIGLLKLAAANNTGIRQAKQITMAPDARNANDPLDPRNFAVFNRAVLDIVAKAEVAGGLDQLSKDRRYAAVALPGWRGLVIVEVTGYQPLYKQWYEGEIRKLIADVQQIDTQTDVTSYQSLKARTGYKAYNETDDKPVPHPNPVADPNLMI